MPSSPVHSTHRSVSSERQVDDVVKGELAACPFDVTHRPVSEVVDEGSDKGRLQSMDVGGSIAPRRARVTTT